MIRVGVLRVPEQLDRVRVRVVWILSALLWQWVCVHAPQHVLVVFVLLIEATLLLPRLLRAQLTRQIVGRGSTRKSRAL